MSLIKKVRAPVFQQHFTKTRTPIVPHSKAINSCNRNVTEGGKESGQKMIGFAKVSLFFREVSSKGSHHIPSPIRSMTHILSELR